MLKIKNRQELELNRLRGLALDLAETALRSIDTAEVIKEKIKSVNNLLDISGRSVKISPAGKLVVLAVGKCALEASVALEDILGSKITKGLAYDVKPDDQGRLRQMKYLAGNHPFPTEQNIENSREVVELLSGLSEADTVLMVISGGASTLLCLPAGESSFVWEKGSFAEFETALMKKLFSVGADIEEINTIRKHLSLARGGNLAKVAFPAQVIGLILSDVPGGHPKMVASGPTYKDDTTVREADEICRRYDLYDSIDFTANFLLDTPKEDKYFEQVHNEVLVSNQQALEAMVGKAKSVGWSAEVVTSVLSGEAGKQGRKISQMLGSEVGGKIFLYGGETTVNITGHGQGGRNRELALGALEDLPEDGLILALASDGRDNGDPAGALVDDLIRKEAEAKKIDPKVFFADNDSDGFFSQVGGHIFTGRTGSNVADLVIALKGEI